LRGRGQTAARVTTRSRPRPLGTTTDGPCGSGGRAGPARPASPGTATTATARRPTPFLDVDVTSHLAFYRAGIAAITEHDPYAGLLVSMHGAGIYRQRYGRDPALGFTRAAEVQELVDAFVAEQEAGYEARIAEAGVSEDDRWRDYELLQLFDRLSLYFCLRDVEAGEAGELQGYSIEPVAPWRIRLEPFPFAVRPAAFTLRRRLLPKGAPAGVLETPAGTVGITIE
jgi:hypothetical protein